MKVVLGVDKGLIFDKRLNLSKEIWALFSLTNKRVARKSESEVLSEIMEVIDNKGAVVPVPVKSTTLVEAWEAYMYWSLSWHKALKVLDKNTTWRN